MVKYRVEWEEDGVKKSATFPGTKKTTAKTLYDRLVTLSHIPSNQTSIKHISFGFDEPGIPPQYRGTYHTPVRRHNKIKNKPTHKLKR
jgi:hypothetical protein